MVWSINSLCDSVLIKLKSLNTTESRILIDVGLQNLWIFEICQFWKSSMTPFLLKSDVSWVSEQSFYFYPLI